MTERRDGHSKLVWDKEAGWYKTVDPHPPSDAGRPDHRSLEWAIDIIRMCEPIRCVQGGMWFSRNHNFADATFVDYGVADAFAVAAKALPALVKALQLQEQAEHAHMNCDECEGEEIPELCQKCFPLYDEARVARRDLLTVVGTSGGDK